MTLYRIPYFAIVPPGIDDMGSGEIIFLYFDHPESTIPLLNQITQNIQVMDSQLLDQLEMNLGLQRRSTSVNSLGKVCFADDPHLRPEFRTTFQAIDLWDYYYALWHSEVYWSGKTDKNTHLPMPQPDIFWSVVAHGQRLREIQSLKYSENTIQISWSENKNKIVEPLEDRFQNTGSENQQGKLFLNKELYLSNVPKKTWDFNLSGVNPMKRWIVKNMNQTVSRNQIKKLSQMVIAVVDTIKTKEIIDQLIRNKFCP